MSLAWPHRRTQGSAMPDPDSPTKEAAQLRLLLTLLLAADAAFIVIHLVHIATPYLLNDLYSIEADGGFAEWFQYTK